jgi:hypothetical protein
MRLFWIFCAAMIGLAAIILLSVSRHKFNHTPEEAGYSLDDSRVSIFSGNNKLSVPRNYLARWSAGQSPDAAVGLHVILPDFAAIKPENQTCFTHACDRILWIVLEPGKFEEPGDSQHAEESFGKSVTGPFGLRSLDRFPGIAEYYARLENGSVFSINCSPQGNTRLPTCHHQEILASNFYLQYDFNIKYLKDWRKIRSQVLNLIHSFQPGP